MAKNNQQESQQEQVATTVSGVEEFFKKNQKWIEWALIALLVIILGIFAYNRWVVTPARQEALNGDGNILGFTDIISNYGSRAGKAVTLYAGLCNLQLGKYDEAIALLKKYNVKDKVMQGRAFCAIGDAYSNLKDYTNALAYYKKAAALGENELTPGYLLKAALVCEETGDNASALKLYKEIESKYPQTVEGYDVQKYISRIENQK